MLRRVSRTGGAADPAAVAVILALAAVGGFVVSPVQNTVSRAIEARADRVSLETTHAGPTFVRMQRRLALASLADPTPPALSQFWWGSHPTVLQRAGLPPVARGGAPMSRVLVVTNDFPTRRGGIETFVLALCQGLPADEVVVYTASMPGDQEYDATLPFPVYRDPGSMLLPTPAVGRRVVEVMRRHGCDRVLFGASAPLGLLGPAAAPCGRPADRRAHARARGVVGEGARDPAAAAPHRRLGRRDDLRQ